MYDRPGKGALLPVGPDMGHNVMAYVLFNSRRSFVVDIVREAAHLFKLLFRYGKPQLPLAFSQGDPQPPPGLELAVVREQAARVFPGVA
jgi:hypothetical protein